MKLQIIVVALLAAIDEWKEYINFLARNKSYPGMEEKKNEEGKSSKPIKNSSEQDLEKPILWVFFIFLHFITMVLSFITMLLCILAHDNDLKPIKNLKWLDYVEESQETAYITGILLSIFVFIVSTFCFYFKISVFFSSDTCPLGGRIKGELRTMANPESEESFKKRNIEREESKQIDVAKNRDRRLLSKKSESSKMTPKKKSGKKILIQESEVEDKNTSTPESQNFEAKSPNPVHVHEEITLSPDTVENTTTPESQNLEEKVQIKQSKRPRKKNLNLES